MMGFWFGKRHKAPVYRSWQEIDHGKRSIMARDRSWQEIDIPVGKFCAWCEEEFTQGDDGIGLNKLPGVVFYHMPCWMRQIVGSIGHQQKKCTCVGGTAEDPPNMSKREAALVASQYYYRENS